MPDVLLVVSKRIDQLMSMSDMKYNAIVRAGIEVVERIPIPPERVPADAGRNQCESLCWLRVEQYTRFLKMI